MLDVLYYWIDLPVLMMLQKVVHVSELLDILFDTVLTRPSFKIMPFVVFVLYVYFCTQNAKRNALLVECAAAAIITLVLSRAMQNLMPLRPRPIHADIPGFVIPYGMSENVLHNWSSFPSDTASLAAALAAAIFCYSKRWGIAAFAWAVLAVSLPRVYAGMHYLSDVIFGLVLGSSVTAIVHYRLASRLIGLFANVLEKKHWQANLAIILFFFQLGMMFDDVRTTASDLRTAAKHDLLRAISSAPMMAPVENRDSHAVSRRGPSGPGRRHHEVSSARGQNLVSSSPPS